VVYDKEGVDPGQCPEHHTPHFHQRCRRPRGRLHDRTREDACPERSDRNTGAHLKSQVADGENRDTMVDVDAPAATDTLCAMLHVYAGQEGALQFPGGGRHTGDGG
jgi:hypothetical protein